jgi:hypothetical protein
VDRLQGNSSSGGARRRRPSAAIAAAIALAALFTWLAGRAQPSAEQPCTAPQYRQFDFWIGNWTVTRPDGRFAGMNRVERIEGGCGVQENWQGAGGGTGRSINAYSMQDGKWHQTWLDSGGFLLRLSGGLRDGRMVLEGRTRGRNGQSLRQRITWTPRGDGRVRQLWEQSKDGGKTWRTAFDGLYSKATAKTPKASGRKRAGTPP